MSERFGRFAFALPFLFCPPLGWNVDTESPSVSTKAAVPVDDAGGGGTLSTEASTK